MADKKTIRLVATNSVRHNKQAYAVGREFEADETSAARLIELGVAVKATSKEGRAAIKEAEAAAYDAAATTEPAPAATERTATKSASDRSPSKGAAKGGSR
jgi:ParB-like chromosome segregation protein Spo0J